MAAPMSRVRTARCTRRVHSALQVVLPSPLYTHSPGCQLPVAGVPTVALWLARQGLRVVVIERERFPRYWPGETLPPGFEPIFAQLGVTNAIEAAGFIRHRGTWVTWSGPRRFDSFGGDRDGPWLGFQAPR